MEVIIINTWRLVLNLWSLHLQVLPEERTGSDQAQGSGPGTQLICNCSSGGGGGGGGSGDSSGDDDEWFHPLHMGALKGPAAKAHQTW